VRLLFKKQKLFVWRYLSAKQKLLSLRPRRLCGETSILDKHAITYRNLLERIQLGKLFAVFMGRQEDFSIKNEKRIFQIRKVLGWALKRKNLGSAFDATDQGMSGALDRSG